MSRKKIIITASCIIVAGIVLVGLFGHSKKTPSTFVPTKSYVALGDSVASGEGLETAQDSSACDRNKEGYPQLVAQKLNAKLTNLACSGAAIGAGIEGPQTVNGLAVPSQVSALEALPKPDFMTLTIGANDLDWTAILAQCYTATCGSAADSAKLQAGLQAYRTHLSTVLSDIDTYFAHKAPVLVLTTYYDVFPKSGTCSDMNGITAQEVDWWRSQKQLFQTAIQETAQKFAFVKVVAIDFSGHELCTSGPWVQPLSSKAPFHPNDAGQAAIAKAISDKAQ